MRFRDFNVSVHRTIQAQLQSPALQEYPGKQHDSTCSAYIASKAGEQFAITVENESDKDASIVFYVDGQMASVLLCYTRPKHNMVVCCGVQPQAGLLRRFVFSKATLTDDATAKEVGNEIGLIKVVIRRCVVMSYGAEATYMNFNSQLRVHEKTQKGLLDTKTALGAPEPFRNGPHANVVYMDHGVPWAEFTFTYKSTDLLQALGIATPAPKDMPNLKRQPTIPLKPEQSRKRPHEEEDNDLREENKRLQMELSRLQRQLTEPLEQTRKPFKTKKVVITKEIEIVDLTED